MSPLTPITRIMAMIGHERAAELHLRPIPSGSVRW